MKYKFLSLLFIFTFLVSCKDQVSNSNPGSVVDTRPVTECVDSDTTAPVLEATLIIKEDGSALNAATISWNKAIESCELSHYELAIGTSLGSEDIMTFSNIGNVTEHQQAGLSLKYDQDYFYSLRAVDGAGNISTPVNSNSWSIFTPNSLTNLVLWLDSADTDSISDDEGDHPGSNDFSNEIKTWQDISGSSAVHNFTASGTSRPNWDVTENAVRFNGSGQFMATVDHTDINMSIIGQRTLTVALKTDSDVSSRQVVYEEGGTVRGINIYIESGKLHCGFWNNSNDGDGLQAFTSVSEVVEVNKQYIISYVFDYSHFSGPSSADGTIECFINKSSIGQESTTSRLHAHSGDIGLGAMNDGSFFPEGLATGNNFFFKGVIFEFLMYNSAHSQTNIEKLSDVLSSKWSK